MYSVLWSKRQKITDLMEAQKTPCYKKYLLMQETPVCWKRDRLPTPVFLGFPCGSAGKETAMQETWIQSLDWEDPIEKGKATHSGILAWSQRVGHDWVTFMLSLIQEWIITGNLWYIKLLSFNTDSWKLFHWNWVQEKYICCDHSYSTLYYRIQQEQLARNESIRLGNE